MRILKMASVLDVVEFMAVTKVASRRGAMGPVELKMAKSMVQGGVATEVLEKLCTSSKEYAESVRQSNDVTTAALLLASVDGDKRLSQIEALQEELSRLTSSVVASYSDKAKDTVSDMSQRADVMSKSLDAMNASQF